MGDMPRIELFAREVVAGWDAWGNEVNEKNRTKSKEKQKGGESYGEL